ncbi:MAG TPA: helix-turn-helix transcriptional regulator [Gammaproteobacteria bacterium]|jgi:transcriptional regulator with XRE-family HTH domain|nr:helix-turn-helix transcriptional regulator [Gammaproteobacteria bacterium]
MTQPLDYSTAPIELLQADLGHRIEALRLGRNIQQRELATEAGVSRRTITRLENGQSVSLDTLLRVMRALGVSGRLASLLPEPAVQPVDRIRLKRRERKRASARRSRAPATWQWADQDTES